MSKAPRRKRPTPDRGSSNAPLLSDHRRRVLMVVSLAVFAGIPFLLGKYFELKYPDPFDSGSYVYSAQHVLSGARVGYEEKPSAQAGTLLVNMLGVTLSGFNETGSKVLQGLFQAAALTLMFITVRRLYGSLAAVISVIVASVYLSAPLIAKFGNVKEQFMIALMIMGICCFVYYRLTAKPWWALLTGALLIGGPLFKQTGVSAIGAVGLFTMAQPILHRYAWKKVAIDVLLLVAGAAITLTPICIWYESMGTPLYYWPYSFALSPVFKLLGADMEYVADTGKAPESRVENGTASNPEQDAHDARDPSNGTKAEPGSQGDSFILRLLPGYVSDSWRLMGPEERAEALRRVLRYYVLLILPITLAAGAILARLVVLVRGGRAKRETPIEPDHGRFVLLFGLWWFFDMAFVWISPHSYEQYYLPLNASGAVLGSYFVGLYAHRYRTDRDGARWMVLGLAGLIVMIVMSWHVFFGIAKSPHSGTIYRDPRGQPIRTRGYLQKWQEIAANGQYDWMRVGDYIRANSERNDLLYVWGWVPGIYVQAQRMSPTPKAFEGTMHTLPPEQLADRVAEILAAFEKRPPKFIVDTRKRHFPWTVPPLELWPSTKSGFLPANEAVEKQYDQMYAKALGEEISPAEARRYEAMQPLRRYVMANYRIAGEYGQQVLFKRK